MRGVPAEFDGLRIERSGGFAGAQETVIVAPGTGGLVATSEAFLQDPTTRVLDDEEAVGLVAAAQALAAAEPAEAAEPRGADMYSWLVELTWAGVTKRFEVTEAPADPSLRDVMAFAAATWSN